MTWTVVLVEPDQVAIRVFGPYASREEAEIGRGLVLEYGQGRETRHQKFYPRAARTYLAELEEEPK